LEAPIRHARRDKDGPRLDCTGVADANRADWAARLKADDVARQHDLSAKAQHLSNRSMGEVSSRNAFGEAQIVLDRGALSSLPARCLALNQTVANPSDAP
jgi:hypothetical protein